MVRDLISYLKDGNALAAPLMTVSAHCSSILSIVSLSFSVYDIHSGIQKKMSSFVVMMLLTLSNRSKSCVGINQSFRSIVLEIVASLGITLLAGTGLWLVFSLHSIKVY